MAVTVVGFAVLTTVSAGAAVAVTVATDGGDVTAVPVGGVPEAVAEFVMLPASRSAAVAEYVAVQTVCDVLPVPAAVSEVDGQVTAGTGPAGAVRASAMLTAVSVTLPVLVTRKL